MIYYGRDSQGRINTVQHYPDLEGAEEQLLVAEVGYEPFGPVKRIAYGNGLEGVYTRDQDYRLDRFDLKHGGDTLHFIDYGYDAANRITQRLGSDHGAVLQYDALDRLIHEQLAGPWISGGLGYSYDASGNRLGLTFDDGSGSPWTTPSSYLSASNRLLTIGDAQISHDAAGNRTGDGYYGWSYNHANRMSALSILGEPRAQYRYNALGQRVQISNAEGRTRHLIYDAAGHYLEEVSLRQDGSVERRIDFIWLDDLPVAQVSAFYSEAGEKTGERLSYLHPDHLNTPRLATDHARRIVWRWEADAFGLVQAMEDPDGDGVGESVRLRFPGQIVDDESGLFYNYFRDYEPGSGRYVESDPIGILRNYSDPQRRVEAQMRVAIPEKTDLRNLNHNYVYANNNPVMYTDPTGEDAGATIAIVWAIAYFSHAGDAISQPNGNMWGRAGDQDNVCTLGPVLGPIGDNCFPDRCQKHDDCYAENQCTASSWTSSALGGTKACNQCNKGFFK